MSEITRCPKCDGELREGELFIDVRIPYQSPTTPDLRGSTSQIFSEFRAMGAPVQSRIYVEGPSWREFTGKQKGWLFKEKEQKIMPIKGRRCLECNYVELYVKEK